MGWGYRYSFILNCLPTVVAILSTCGWQFVVIFFSLFSRYKYTTPPAIAPGWKTCLARLLPLRVALGAEQYLCHRKLEIKDVFEEHLSWTRWPFEITYYCVIIYVLQYLHNKNLLSLRGCTQPKKGLEVDSSFITSKVIPKRSKAVCPCVCLVFRKYSDYISFYEQVVIPFTIRFPAKFPPIAVNVFAKRQSLVASRQSPAA